jgi:hypothetical protein
MAGREADGAGIVCEIVKAERRRVADEHAEDAPARGHVADRRALRVVDTGREEALEPLLGSRTPSAA